MGQALLNIEDLKTYFYTDAGVVKAVAGVDLRIRAGTTRHRRESIRRASSRLRSAANPATPGKIVPIYSLQNRDL